MPTAEEEEAARRDLFRSVSAHTHTVVRLGEVND
jgi:hypothetical protein